MTPEAATQDYKSINHSAYLKQANTYEAERFLISFALINDLIFTLRLVVLSIHVDHFWLELLSLGDFSCRETSWDHRPWCEELHGGSTLKDV